MAFKGRRPNFGQEITEAFEKALERSVSEAVAAADADLKDSSPVDSGRFRSSWFQIEAKSGTPDTNAVQPAGKDSYPAPAKLSPDQIDGSANQVLINNLNYAQRLCEQGWSKKVPENWFTNIKQRWVAGKYLDEAFRRNVKLS